MYISFLLTLSQSFFLRLGRKRTEEMTKLQTNDKGDMYDFKLDGGMATQVFEGVDYSTKDARERELLAQSAFFLEPGKRERKVIRFTPSTLCLLKDSD